MSLTKREKTLLFIMVMLGIILGFVMLVILPMNQAIQDNQLLKTDLQFQQSEIQMKLALENTLKAKQDEKLAQINDSLAKIEDPLIAAEFERWVLPLANSYRMPISRVVLSEAEVVAPNAKQLTINEPSYRLKELIEEYKKEVPEADLIPMTESVLLKQTHTYEVGSSYTYYKSFLDDVSMWNTSIFIADSSYDFTNRKATFTFDVYSIHKIENTSDKDYNGDYIGASYHPGNDSTSPTGPSDHDNPTYPEYPGYNPMK